MAMNAPTSPLFDADAARTSQLAASRRATTSVADADFAFRAGLVDEYVATCRTGDEFAELKLLAEAKRYDDAHPGERPLVEELIGTQLRRAA